MWSLLVPFVSRSYHVMWVGEIRDGRLFDRTVLSRPRLTRFLSHSVMLPPFLRHSRNSRERSERRGERVTMEGARYAHS